MLPRSRFALVAVAQASFLPRLVCGERPIRAAIMKPPAVHGRCGPFWTSPCLRVRAHNIPISEGDKLSPGRRSAAIRRDVLAASLCFLSGGSLAALSLTACSVTAAAGFVPFVVGAAIAFPIGIVASYLGAASDRLLFLSSASSLSLGLLAAGVTIANISPAGLFALGMLTGAGCGSLQNLGAVLLMRRTSDGRRRGVFKATLTALSFLGTTWLLFGVGTSAPLGLIPGLTMQGIDNIAVAFRATFSLLTSGVSAAAVLMPGITATPGPLIASITSFLGVFYGISMWKVQPTVDIIQLPDISPSETLKDENLTEADEPAFAVPPPPQAELRIADLQSVIAWCAQNCPSISEPLPAPCYRRAPDHGDLLQLFSTRSVPVTIAHTYAMVPDSSEGLGRHKETIIKAAKISSAIRNKGDNLGVRALPMTDIQALHGDWFSILLPGYVCIWKLSRSSDNKSPVPSLFAVQQLAQRPSIATVQMLSERQSTSVRRQADFVTPSSTEHARQMDKSTIMGNPNSVYRPESWTAFTSSVSEDRYLWDSLDSGVPLGVRFVPWGTARAVTPKPSSNADESTSSTEESSPEVSEVFGGTLYAVCSDNVQVFDVALHKFPTVVPVPVPSLSLLPWWLWQEHDENPLTVAFGIRYLASNPKREQLFLSGRDDASYIYSYDGQRRRAHLPPLDADEEDLADLPEDPIRPSLHMKKYVERSGDASIEEIETSPIGGLEYLPACDALVAVKTGRISDSGGLTASVWRTLNDNNSMKLGPWKCLGSWDMAASDEIMRSASAGTRLALVNAAGLLRVIDIMTGASAELLLSTSLGSPFSVTAVAFAPDGERVAIALCHESCRFVVIVAVAETEVADAIGIAAAEGVDLNARCICLSPLEVYISPSDLELSSLLFIDTKTLIGSGLTTESEPLCVTFDCIGTSSESITEAVKQLSLRGSGASPLPHGGMLHTSRPNLNTPRCDNSTNRANPTDVQLDCDIPEIFYEISACTEGGPMGQLAEEAEAAIASDGNLSAGDRAVLTVEARFWRCNAHNLDGDVADAALVAEETVMEFPQCYRAHLLAGWITQFGRQDIRAASIHYETALTVKKGDFESSALLGTMYLASDNPEGAEKYLRMALAARPKSVLALNNLGNCMMAKPGGMMEAREKFLEAAQLAADQLEVIQKNGSPVYPFVTTIPLVTAELVASILATQGQLYRRLLDLDAAEDAYREAVTFYPSSLLTNVNFASLLLVEKDPPDVQGAKDCLSRCDRNDPDAESILSKIKSLVAIAEGPDGSERMREFRNRLRERKH